MTDQKISESFEAIAALLYNADRLVQADDYDSALVMLTVDLDDARRRLEALLAPHCDRGTLARRIGITPQAVSKRYPGAFSN